MTQTSGPSRCMGTEPACKRGCWWCCTIPVVVVPIEAVHIVGWLEQNGRFTKGVGKRLKIVSQRRWDDQWTSKAGCAFLRDGECSIYPARPTRCPGHYGTDAKICRAHHLYGHEIAGDVTMLGGTHMLAQGMTAAKIQAVSERKPLLLEDAILAVRDVGGAERAWQRLRVPLPVFGREWPCPTLEEYASSVQAVDPARASLGRPLAVRSDAVGRRS